MLQGSRHYFHGFVLTVFKEAYLVEVNRCDESVVPSSAGCLPEWIFDSRRAIWIDGKKGTIKQRALEGERIKNLLAKNFAR